LHGICLICGFDNKGRRNLFQDLDFLSYSRTRIIRSGRWIETMERSRRILMWFIAPSPTGSLQPSRRRKTKTKARTAYGTSQTLHGLSWTNWWNRIQHEHKINNYWFCEWWIWVWSTTCESVVFCVWRGLRQKGVDVWIDIDAEMQIFVLLCNLFISKREKISQSLEGSVGLEITIYCECRNCLFLKLLFICYLLWFGFTRCTVLLLLVWRDF